MAYVRKCEFVTFIYDADELFDKVAMQSAYLSRTLKSQDGEYAGEEVVLTHDEDDVYEECFKKCAEDFVNMLPKTVTDFHVDDEFCVSFAFNGMREIVLKHVDAGIEAFMLYGILKKWFEVCGNASFVEYCGTIQTDTFRKLWSNMFEMRNRRYN